MTDLMQRDPARFQAPATAQLGEERGEQAHVMGVCDRTEVADAESVRETLGRRRRHEAGVVAAVDDVHRVSELVLVGAGLSGAGLGDGGRAAQPPCGRPALEGPGEPRVEVVPRVLEVGHPGNAQAAAQPVRHDVTRVVPVDGPDHVDGSARVQQLGGAGRLPRPGRVGAPAQRVAQGLEPAHERDRRRPLQLRRQPQRVEVRVGQTAVERDQTRRGRGERSPDGLDDRGGPRRWRMRPIDAEQGHLPAEGGQLARHVAGARGGDVAHGLGGDRDDEEVALRVAHRPTIAGSGPAISGPGDDAESS